jgi:hypothetical protein
MSAGVAQVFINSIHSLVFGGVPSLPVAFTNISLITMHCACIDAKGTKLSSRMNIERRRILSTDLL